MLLSQVNRWGHRFWERPQRRWDIIAVRVWKEGAEPVTQGTEGMSCSNSGRQFDRQKTGKLLSDVFVDFIGRAAFGQQNFRNFSRCLKLAFTQAFFYMSNADIYRKKPKPQTTALRSTSLQNTTVGEVDFGASNWLNWNSRALWNKLVNAFVPSLSDGHNALYLQDDLKTSASLNCSCRSSCNLMGRNSTLQLFLPMRTRCQVRV